MGGTFYKRLADLLSRVSPTSTTSGQPVYLVVFRGASPIEEINSSYNYKSDLIVYDYNKDDLIFLLIKNLKQKRLNKKLLNKVINLFRVRKYINI